MTSPALPTPARVFDRAAATVRFIRSLAASRLSSADRDWRIGRAAYYRDLWSEAAAEVGAEVSALPNATLELSCGARSLRVRETYCSIECEETLARAGDKVLVARLLAEAGLPVPPQQAVTLSSLADARRFLTSMAGPFVVKPAEYTGGGQGVTTNVRTWRDLRRAATSAAAAGARAGRVGSRDGAIRRLRTRLLAIGDIPLLVQSQVPGANYRLLYLDGVLIDAVRRDVPVVVGDGSSTVGALVEAANSVSGRGELMIRRDLDLEQTLIAQGLCLNAVPVAGRIVQLKTMINENAQISNHPAVDELSTEIIEDGRRAAELVGVRLAGVDILTRDPSRSLTDSGGCVLEVNTTPGLAMHYHGHPGEVPVATTLLRQMFTSPRQISCGC